MAKGAELTMITFHAIILSGWNKTDNAEYREGVKKRGTLI